jgi:hypothetical protein
VLTLAKNLADNNYTYEMVSKVKTPGHIKKEYIVRGKNGKIKYHITLTANKPSDEALRRTVDTICELF